MAGLSAAFCRGWLSSPYAASLEADEAYWLLRFHMLEADGEAAGMPEEVLRVAVGCPAERWDAVTRKWERHQVAVKREGCWSLREFKKRSYTRGGSTERMRRMRERRRMEKASASGRDAHVTPVSSVTEASPSVTCGSGTALSLRREALSARVSGDRSRGGEEAFVTPQPSVTEASPEHVNVYVVSNAYKNDVNVKDTAKKGVTGGSQVSFMPGIAERSGQMCMPGTARDRRDPAGVTGYFVDLVGLIPERHRNEGDLAVLLRRFEMIKNYEFVRSNVVYSVREHVNSAARHGQDPDDIFWKFLMGSLLKDYARKERAAARAASEAGRLAAEKRKKAEAPVEEPASGEDLEDVDVQLSKFLVKFGVVGGVKQKNGAGNIPENNSKEGDGIEKTEGGQG